MAGDVAEGGIRGYEPTILSIFTLKPIPRSLVAFHLKDWKQSLGPPIIYSPHTIWQAQLLNNPPVYAFRTCWTTLSAGDFGQSIWHVVVTVCASFLPPDISMGWKARVVAAKDS
eukprot:2616112-Amphidinium_carterae.1